MRLPSRRRRSDAALVPALAAAREALDRAERGFAEADAAHREAYATQVARWQGVARGERPPEDVRQALARTATVEHYRRLQVARAEVERARRAYWAAREGR